MLGIARELCALSRTVVCVGVCETDTDVSGKAVAFPAVPTVP